MSQDMPLTDDLADVLTQMVVGWSDIIGHDLAEHPEVVRVMARYRTERDDGYPSVTEEPQVPDCAQCATYQHDISYHDDESYPSVTALDHDDERDDR